MQYQSQIFIILVVFSLECCTCLLQRQATFISIRLKRCHSLPTKNAKASLIAVTLEESISLVSN